MVQELLRLAGSGGSQLQRFKFRGGPEGSFISDIEVLTKESLALARALAA